MIQLLGSMKISVSYPVMERVDDIGAIFMVSNITTMSCTKHMNIRYKYVNEYVEGRVVKTVFVKSADNDSIILAKNLSAEHNKKHPRKRWGNALIGCQLQKYLKLKGRVLEMMFQCQIFVLEYFDDQGESNLTAGQLGQLQMILVMSQLTVRDNS